MKKPFPFLRFGLIVLVGCGSSMAQNPHELSYHHSIKFAPIAGAIFSNPAVGDFDGDGNVDLIVATKHRGAGVYFYQGETPHNQSRRFAAPVKLDLPRTLISAVDWNRDGLPDLLVRSDHLAIRLNQGGTPPRFATAQPLRDQSGAPLVAPIEYATVISTADSHTIITGRNDFAGYWPGGDNHRTADIGLWQGYDSSGIWKGKENAVSLHAWHFMKDSNRLHSQQPLDLSKGAHKFLTGASPIAIDTDRDGDHDLVITDFNGAFSIALNIGSDRSPEFSAAAPLQTADGTRVRSPQCFVMGQRYDWNNDGWDDLIYGCEDGFVYVSLNHGSASKSPLFLSPFKVTGSEPPLDLGVAACAWSCDLDRNGLPDLLVGNAAGELWQLTNRGDHHAPSFGMPRPIRVNHQPFRLQAGYAGSIQGPAEATWGYIAPSMYDLDYDGDLDIVFSGITGYHHALLNLGTDKSPRWAKPQPIMVAGKPLRTVWRTRPIATRWDNDDLVDYVCLNDHGIVGHYRGRNPDQWNDFSEWTAWEFIGGQPIDVDGPNGLEGRSKLCLADWDGDGRRDLLIGLKGDSAWSRKLGRPKLTYIMFLRNLTEIPIPSFDHPRPIRLKTGADIELGDHTACPSVITLYDDTEPGLLIGCENGRLYYFSRKQLQW